MICRISYAWTRWNIRESIQFSWFWMYLTCLKFNLADFLPFHWKPNLITKHVSYIQNRPNWIPSSILAKRILRWNGLLSKITIYEKKNKIAFYPKSSLIFWRKIWNFGYKNILGCWSVWRQMIGFIPNYFDLSIIENTRFGTAVD